MSDTQPQRSMAKLEPLPSFDIRREDEDGAAVTLRLFGELDIATSPRFEQTLSAAEKSAAKRITIDLAGLTFIDSSGLRAPTQASDRTDGRLHLLRGSATVQRLFTLTGLDTELPFTD